MYDSSSQQVLSAHKFTGKERDAESGLDYFEARYYSSQYSRWMSSDWSGMPEPVPYAEFTDPQSLCLYSYLRNNPLSHADADGHCCESAQNFVVDTGKSMINQLLIAPANLVLRNVYENLQRPPQIPELEVKSKAAAITGTVLSLVIPLGEEAVAVRGLNQAERAAIGAARNIMSRELRTKTLQAAAREAAGEVVATKASGQAFDHITKVEQGLTGLIERAKTLTNSLRDKTLSPEAREVLRRNLGQINKTINKTKKFIKDHDIPM